MHRGCEGQHQRARPSRDLKACIVGILGTRSALEGDGRRAAGDAANDLTLLEVIRERLGWLQPGVGGDRAADFARAAIVTLAIDGLMMRESLRISPFSEGQRDRS